MRSWANVWYKEYVAIIDIPSATVVGWVDFTAAPQPLPHPVPRTSSALNSIVSSIQVGRLCADRAASFTCGTSQQLRRMRQIGIVSQLRSDAHHERALPCLPSVPSKHGCAVRSEVVLRQLYVVCLDVVWGQLYTFHAGPAGRARPRRRRLPQRHRLRRLHRQSAPPPHLPAPHLLPFLLDRHRFRESIPCLLDTPKLGHGCTRPHTHARVRTHAHTRADHHARAHARSQPHARTQCARTPSSQLLPRVCRSRIGSLPLVLRQCSLGLFITGKLYERLLAKGRPPASFLACEYSYPPNARVSTHAHTRLLHMRAWLRSALMCMAGARSALRALCVRWVTYRMSHGAEHAPWYARGHEVCIPHPPCSTATPLRSGDHPREVTLDGGAALDALDGSSYEWMRASGSTQFAIRQVI